MIIVKIGGSIVSDTLHPSIFDDLITILRHDKIIVVHGGGRQVTSVATKLGLEQKFIVSPGGIRSRYTDRETAEAYTMVMSGQVNKTIVTMLLKHGIRAVGIAGIDGGSLRAERKKKLLIINDKGRRMAIDGGYTGKIDHVDSSLIDALLDKHFVPVISPIALGEEFEYLNVDGDRAAAHIAGAIRADRVIFLTNVAGLLVGGRLIENLTLNEAKKMLPNIGFGMEKKVLACTEALELGVAEAIIGNGSRKNPISSLIAHDSCTVIKRNEQRG
jgi:acetylglutamate/LysW-gamma-L-alpha-aminoadipate kinase